MLSKLLLLLLLHYTKVIPTAHFDAFPIFKAGRSIHDTFRQYHYFVQIQRSVFHVKDSGFRLFAEIAGFEDCNNIEAYTIMKSPR